MWLTVEGSSMVPLLRRGDRVLVQPCSAASVTPGDLVVMGEGAHLCTHRLISKMHRDGRDYLRTKGDDCGRWDEPLPVERLIGKVTVIDRGARQIRLERAVWRVLNRLLLVYSLLMGWLLWSKWRLQA